MTLTAAILMPIDSSIPGEMGLALTTHPPRTKHMNWLSFTRYRVNTWSGADKLTFPFEEIYLQLLN